MKQKIRVYDANEIDRLLKSYKDEIFEKYSKTHSSSLKGVYLEHSIAAGTIMERIEKVSSYEISFKCKKGRIEEIKDWKRD